MTNDLIGRPGGELVDEDGLVSVAKGIALSPDIAAVIPLSIVNAGPRGLQRWAEFFTAQIANQNTRAAYLRATTDFFKWLEARGVADLEDISSHHVAVYRDEMGQFEGLSVASVKMKMAAIRSLFAYLKEGGVIMVDPAAPVRAPKHSVRVGKTPVLDADEVRKLLESIPTDTIAGLRDRALIAVMVFTFARISAAVGINVEDVYRQGMRLWIRLREKGGKEHTMPCHHRLEEYLTEYLEAAGIGEDKKSPLFRSAAWQSKELTDKRFNRTNAWQMVRRRAEAAGISTHACNHTFRGSGITTFLENGGRLENARNMAAHASVRTTQLYDRRGDKVTLEDVNLIRIFDRER